MMEESIKFGSGSVALDPSPINSSWILEGNPVARSRVLSSRDGAFSVIWDCTAGKFNWFYDYDETVYIIEGSVRLKDAKGVQRRVSAGETVHFPAGSRAEWVVDKYIRKVAFCTRPQPRLIGLLNRVWRLRTRLAGVRRAEISPAL
jgi:uncharacterized protein